MKNVRWIVGLLFSVLFVLPAYSLVIKSGETIEIAENEVIDDDLVAFARTIDIKGKVNGDVYAFAQEVSISGGVDGSIFSGGANIDIDVKKAKTICAAGGNIKISGIIERNVLLFGGSLFVGENARIGKDLRAYGGRLTVNGDINGAIKGGVGKFAMGGKTNRIKISADEVKIKSGAVIAGDVIVQGDKEPIIEEGAVITGETKLLKKEKKEKDKEAFFAFAPIIAFLITMMKIIVLVAKIITGIIIIALFKKYTRRIMDTLIKSPWKSLGWGFLALIVLPVAVVILFMILIGFPLAVFGSYIYSILFYLSSIFVALVIGEKIIQLFKKQGKISLYPSLIIGVLVLFVLGLIPILGFLIRLFVVLFGTGMLVIGSWDLIKEMKEKKLI